MKKIEFSITVENIFLAGDKSGEFKIRESNVLGLIRNWYFALAEESIKAGKQKTWKQHSECRFSWNPIKDLLRYSSKIEKAKKELCPTCFFFGTTGWAKRFYFRVSSIKEKISDDITSKYSQLKNKKSSKLGSSKDRYEIKMDFIIDHFSSDFYKEYLYDSIVFLMKTFDYIKKNKGAFTANTMSGYTGNIVDISFPIPNSLKIDKTPLEKYYKLKFNS